MDKDQISNLYASNYDIDTLFTHVYPVTET